MELFVGNLPFSITEQEIIVAFSAHGKVESLKMLTDRFSGRFRGIAFVVMPDESEARAAIAALNDSDLGGRSIRVDQSRERPARFGSSGGSFERPRQDDARPRGRGRAGFRPRFENGAGRGGFRPHGAPRQRDGSDFRDAQSFGDSQ
ncbi:MAG: RNA-binding protein [Verrucomicrobia bacterium]|nr:MAG: RNA-binding protein [Verrucomicrobiota bacterium]